MKSKYIYVDSSYGTVLEKSIGLFYSDAKKRAALILTRLGANEGRFLMEKLEKLGWAFILMVLFAAWAMWYQSSRAAVALCEADLPACEAAYFASLDR